MSTWASQLLPKDSDITWSNGKGVICRYWCVEYLLTMFSFLLSQGKGNHTVDYINQVIDDFTKDFEKVEKVSTRKLKYQKHACHPMSQLLRGDRTMKELALCTFALTRCLSEAKTSFLFHRRSREGGGKKAWGFLPPPPPVARVPLDLGLVQVLMDDTVFTKTNTSEIRSRQNWMLVQSKSDLAFSVVWDQT